MIFHGYPGGAQVESTQPGVVTGWSVAPRSQIYRSPIADLQSTDHQLLTCKQLKADTRLANCSLQTGGLEMIRKSGKLDCQLVVEMIGRTWDRQIATYSSQPGGP